jgi:hypothetical protein
MRHTTSETARRFPAGHFVAAVVVLLAGLYVGGFVHLVVRGNGVELPRQAGDRIFLNVRRVSPFRMTPFQSRLYYPLLVLDGAEETDLDIPFRHGRYPGFVKDLANRLGLR